MEEAREGDELASGVGGWSAVGSVPFCDDDASVLRLTNLPLSPRIRFTATWWRDS